jgi:hypothetical protein
MPERRLEHWTAQFGRRSQLGEYPRPSGSVLALVDGLSSSVEPPLSPECSSTAHRERLEHASEGAPRHTALQLEGLAVRPRFMKYVLIIPTSLALSAMVLVACGSDSTPSSGSPDAAGAPDSAITPDAADAAGDGAPGCSSNVCASSSSCAGIPYDSCGPINTACSCIVTCLEADGGTNCPGDAPCKTSSEGTKYCAAAAVK